MVYKKTWNELSPKARPYHISLRAGYMVCFVISSCDIHGMCHKMSYWTTVYRKVQVITWWRHQMEASSALLAICAGSFPAQRQVTWSFDISFDLCLNELWHRALMFSLICAWINGWENNREAGDLRRYRAHYGVIVMQIQSIYDMDVCLIAEIINDFPIFSFQMHIQHNIKKKIKHTLFKWLIWYHNKHICPLISFHY